MLGWLLFAGAAFYAIQVWKSDRELQRFRAPGQNSSRYALVPLRWKPELYSDSGHPVLAAAKRAWLMMFVLVVLAMIALVASKGLRG